MNNPNPTGEVILTFNGVKIILTTNKKVSVTKKGTIMIKEPKK